MTFPSKNTAVPNALVFSIVTTLIVLLVTWKLPKSCAVNWETCVLDATEAPPLVVLFYCNMFYKTSSKCKHFDYLRSILPWSKATRTELALTVAIVVCGAWHFFVSFPKPYTMAGAAYFSTYLLTAATGLFVLVQFGSVVHELNEKFSGLIRKSRSLSVHLLSEQWDIFCLIDSINKIYGSSLMMLSIWLSGRFVNNIFRAAQQAIFDKNGLVCSFLCVSAFINFAPFFYAMQECERTKLLAEAFNDHLFKLMRSSKELRRDSKLFLHVTMRQTVKFTACGFFNLGYPLLTSIIAAATTYLVILLQFSIHEHRLDGANQFA